MIKDDYSKKMIEQFKLSLIEINEMKATGNNEASLDVVHKWIKEILKMDFRLLGTLNTHDLIELIKEKGYLNADKGIIFARLIEEKAKIFADMSEFNISFNTYVSSLHIMLEAYLVNSTPELKDEYSKIESIYSLVSKYELPLAIKSMLFEYHRQNEQYCSAEDMIYEILEECNYDDFVVKVGIGFYKQLLEKSDEELEAFDLPRVEVQDGLDTLIKKLI